LIVGVHAAEVVPVLVISTTKQRLVVDHTAAVVNGRQVVSDRTQMSKLDILFHNALTSGPVLTIQLTTYRYKHTVSK